MFSPAQGKPTQLQASVCPVWRVAVGRFGGLRLGLQCAGLVALTGATLRKREDSQGWSGPSPPTWGCRARRLPPPPAHLSILREVVVQQLRGRLLVGGQDVQERWGRVPGRCSRAQGPGGAQGRGQAERGWSPCMESLLVKRLQGRETTVRASWVAPGPAWPPSARPPSPESCCRQTQSYQGGQRCLKSPTLLEGKAAGSYHSSRAQLWSPPPPGALWGGLA